MSDLGFVGPVGQQIDVRHPRGLIVPAKTLRAVEIDVITFLGKVGAGLSVSIEIHVIVEFTLVIEGPA